MQIASVAAVNVAGGMVTRAIDHDTSTVALDKPQIAVDAVAGGTGGAVGGGVGKLLTGEAESVATSLQVETAQANRQIMQGVIAGDSATITAGQSTRSAADMQSAAVGASVKASTAAARATAARIATDAAEDTEKHWHD